MMVTYAWVAKATLPNEHLKPFSNTSFSGTIPRC